MTETMCVAVSRRGHSLEAAPKRFVMTENIAEVANKIASTLRYEKSIMKGHIRPEHGVYERFADYSDLSGPTMPEYTLPRDDRSGMPRRITFDNVVPEIDGVDVRPVGHEEPSHTPRTREFGLDFGSADLTLEGIVELRPGGLGSIKDVNARINPMGTDVRVVSGLGDTICHALMADPELLPPDSELDRDFVADYMGDLCISPCYERLVETVLGTRCLDDVTFAYPDDAPEEETVIVGTDIGIYLMTTGSTTHEHGLVLGEHLFPSKTTLVENVAEATPAVETVKRAIASPELETELKV